jgi:broad-specificity NMP kinase
MQASEPDRPVLPLTEPHACALQLLDELEDEMEVGGAVVEYHGAELFPERWFDLVLVLRSDNGVLYERLESRYTFPT